MAQTGTGLDSLGRKNAVAASFAVTTITVVGNSIGNRNRRGEERRGEENPRKQTECDEALILHTCVLMT